MEVKSNDCRWYAVYTAPRAEKAVSERFSTSGITHYLALQKVKHHWSDRLKEVMVPVIKGYIFVFIPTIDFNKVTGIYGAIAFVKQGGLPIPIPDQQMQSFQFMVSHADVPVEYSNEQYEHGETILVNKGPLQGMIGELIEIKGKHIVQIRLAKFGCALISIPVSFVERIKQG
jgi:transcription antitermination factor NusG